MEGPANGTHAAGAGIDEKGESLLRRAETILRQRTDRLVLVLERVLDTTNWVGCLRTAEILGIQNVWVVQLPRGYAKEELEKKKQRERSKEGRVRAQQQAAQETAAGSGAAGSAQTDAKATSDSPAPAAAQHGRAGKRRHKSDAASGAPPQDEDAAMVSEDAACQQGAGSGYEGEADGDLTLAEGVAAELVDTTGPGATVDEDRLRQENKKRLRFSRASSQWLDVRFFGSIESCVRTLKEEGWQIWATDLSRASVSLTDSPCLDPFPERVALVMGREADGVSKEMLAAADRRVYLPMFGFNASLNVMVATGMVLQATLQRWPQLRGAMSEERRTALRKDWYSKLARTEEQRTLFLGRVDSPPQPYDIHDLKNILAAQDQ